MSIKQFYEWAKEKGIEDYEIVCSECGYEAWTFGEENIEVDDDEKEVIL